MPNMADITVKKNDGTTDVIYVAKQPSSGDGTPAVWKLDGSFTSDHQKPVFTFSSMESGDRRSRRVKMTYRYPQVYTDTATGLVKVANVTPWEVSGTLPKEMPQTVLDEAAAQLANLFKAALIQAAAKAGYAPT